MGTGDTVRLVHAAGVDGATFDDIESNPEGIEGFLNEIQRWSVPPLDDVLVVVNALDKTESRRRKSELDRMAAMLSRLGGRGYQVGEDSVMYESTKNDPDPDSDPDLS